MIPTVKTFPKWEWVLVSSGISAITLNNLHTGYEFYYTTRDVDGTAPDAIIGTKIPAEAVKMFNKTSEFTFEVQTAVDFYAFCFSIDNTTITDGSLLVREGAGNSLPINPLGGIDTNVQDQYTNTVILPIAQQLGLTNLTAQAVLDEAEITVDSVVGMTIGNHIRIINAAADRYYFGGIFDIIGNVVYLDTPLDYDYMATSEVTFSNINLAVNGSVTPIHFHLRTGAPSIPSSVDITKVVMVCQCDSAVDLNKFGNIVGGLDKGLVFRSSNGAYYNRFNVKTNADLAAISPTWVPFAASNPAQGVDGFSWELTFGGQNRVGVVIRVEQDGQLGVIVQDDLSDLVSLFCYLEGHVVE